MIILSYNSRGLGSCVKLRAIRELVRKERIEMLLIQESKCELVDLRLCRSLWGAADYEWVFKPSANSSGGLITIWQSNKFTLLDSHVGEGFLAVRGQWDDLNGLCGIINVYAPCSAQGKRELWEAIEVFISNAGLTYFCIAGDFNSIRTVEERRGVASSLSTGRRDMEDFNIFIANNQLLEPPVAGKLFTWFRPNGQAASRLDRFFVSSDWASSCAIGEQRVLSRDFSDHCPVLFHTSNLNWGPKPFKVLNCWFSDPRFAKFVSKEWESFCFSGTGAFVLKEKLKRIKACLRTWNSEVFGDIQRNSKEILRKIQSLDEKLEEVGLSMEEQNQRRTWQAEYWRLAKSNESLLQQKSRCNWIREGDSNTKFFHSFMNWRRNANSVLGMEIDGVWINDPVLVKNGAKDF
ncbi:uncharacterized protein LOC130740454 [Lotus japonicus]|uniref:uncharacterized protein LOC130740454 n=1 Tax=Lotus japonicus TaxID=34305 RepID=UPI002583FFEC|nr:uncharacterized protein LOC130740454 [Lotus japonicus]